MEKRKLSSITDEEIKELAVIVFSSKFPGPFIGEVVKIERGMKDMVFVTLKVKYQYFNEGFYYAREVLNNMSWRTTLAEINWLIDHNFEVPLHQYK